MKKKEQIKTTKRALNPTNTQPSPEKEYLLFFQTFGQKLSAESGERVE